MYLSLCFLFFRMETPSSLPAFLRCKCVAARLRQRAPTYSMKGRKKEISKLKTESLSALTDGITVYLNKKDGFTPEFEIGVGYVLQKYALSNTFGQMYLLALAPSNSRLFHKRSLRRQRHLQDKLFVQPHKL